MQEFLEAQNRLKNISQENNENESQEENKQLKDPALIPFLKQSLEIMSIESKKVVLEMKIFEKMLKDLEEKTNDDEKVDNNLSIEAFIRKKTEILEKNAKIDHQSIKMVELLTIFEESYQEKTKTLNSKCLFLDYCVKIHDQNKLLLESVFDRLNEVEDEYSNIENSISKLQKAHKQNTDEVFSIRRRIEHIKTQKLKIEAETRILESESENATNIVEKQKEEIDALILRNDQMRNEILLKSGEYEQLQVKVLLEQFSLFEQKEKLSYLEEINGRYFQDIPNYQKMREKLKIEINVKTAALKEILKKTDATENEIRRAEKILDYVEKSETT